MMRVADGKDGGLRLTGVGLACIGGWGGGVSVIGLLLIEKAGRIRGTRPVPLAFGSCRAGIPKSLMLGKIDW